MGFFKSVRDLQKQSNEISKNWDVGAQLAGAQASMEQANAMLAQGAAAATVAQTGMPAAATVVALREGFGEINFQPIVEIDMTVLAPGRPPYPVTMRQAMPIQMVAAMRPGANLNVKVDPANPATVWIDPTSVNAP
jgi:hypothetical protein